jgi:hypothetical protein
MSSLIQRVTSIAENKALAATQVRTLLLQQQRHATALLLHAFSPCHLPRRQLTSTSYVSFELSFHSCVFCVHRCSARISIQLQRNLMARGRQRQLVTG